MDPLSPSTRRANRWLFAALVIFAVALSVVCFLWMRGVVRANGGVADPQRPKTSLRNDPLDREPTARVDFVLPIATPCFT